MLKKVYSMLSQLSRLSSQLNEVETSVHLMRESLGRIENRQIENSSTVNNLGDTEFRAFSQWGDDGIIQYLVREINPQPSIFIEFGVENYKESNTRFLLINNNWTGLIIDGSKKYIEAIKRQPIYWKRNLKAVNEFITVENINSILRSNGVIGEVGLLSVDVDGNDYWIWKAIDCISPAIVVCEYNYRFGSERAVTIPYNANFIRSKAHYSTIYYGASLKALNVLAESKGYVLVGCNSAGNNAFFVRSDIKPLTMKAMSVEESFMKGQYRESRHPDGRLAYLSRDSESEILLNLPVVEVPT